MEATSSERTLSRFRSEATELFKCRVLIEVSYMVQGKLRNQPTKFSTETEFVIVAVVALPRVTKLG